MERANPDRLKWWDFIGHRRRYLSDRTWLGAGLVAIGLGTLGVISGWWKGLDLVVVALGAGLILSGVRRAIHRKNPGPPW